MKPASEDGGEHHEMVIVYPDEILVRIDDFHDLICKNHAGGDIRLPIGGAVANPIPEGAAMAVVGGHGELVMEERPEIVLTEAVIEAIVNLGRDKHREAAESIGEESGNGVLLGRIDLDYQGADEPDLDGGGEAVLELEHEGVVV